MCSLHATTGAIAAGLLVLTVATAAGAVPITPTRDDEVIEVLPASAGNRSEDRQLRKRLAERPDDVALATAVARRFLEQARESGDPRFAGLALAALSLLAGRDASPPTTSSSCARPSSSTCTSSTPRSRTCACCWRGAAASASRRPG